jgi:hypothetical protein
MKPKQKHKRGADRYSLDIYTPLTRDECIERLRTKQKYSPLGRLHLYCKDDQFTVTLLYGLPLISTDLSIDFVGQFEPTITGTHIYGRTQFIYQRVNFPFSSLFIVLFGCSGIAIAFAWLKAWILIPIFGSLGAFFTLGDAVADFLKIRFEVPKLLLRWIEEQLNVEATDETETEA